MKKYDHLQVYTDGAVSNNGYAGARGGWAYAIYHEDELIHSCSGFLPETTNQRAEITAAIEGMRKAKEYDFFSCEIISDSAYVINAFNQSWLVNWEVNGWLNARKEPVKNQDLWKEFLRLWNYNEKFHFIKVKGHSGNERNEFVDALAVRAKGD